MKFLKILAYATVLAFTIYGTFTLLRMNFNSEYRACWVEPIHSIRLLETIVGIYAVLFFIRKIKKEISSEINE